MSAYHRSGSGQIAFCVKLTATLHTHGRRGVMNSSVIHILTLSARTFPEEVPVFENVLPAEEAEFDQLGGHQLDGHRAV